jgi:hypothetical protein
MKIEVKNFLYRYFTKTRVTAAKICSLCWKKIKTSYALCRDGEEELKNLLLYWCIMPMVIYILIMAKIGPCRICRGLFDLLAIILATLDLFFIQKSLKKHPEYDSEFVKETEREMYYASLNPEELRKVKLEEKKEGAKNFVKKMLLIGSGDKIDSYKIVRLLMALMLLIALKRLLF